MELFEYIDILNQPFDIFYSHSTKSPLHWHHYSEILYIRKGRIRLICTGQSFILEENDICYIYPLQLHEIQKVDEGEVEYAVIKFDIHTLNIPKAFIPKLYNYFAAPTSKNDICIVVNHIFEKNFSIMNCIENTIEEYEKKQELYMLQVQSNIFSILIAIARTCSKTLHTSDQNHQKNTISFSHIIEYIDVHSSENIQIQDLVRMCNMSYSHFARLFKENYGRSCKEYINYIRLNKADELLTHTNYDISYIANETGFFDSSHFIHAYKKWKGITPKQYRMHLDW